MAVRSRGARSHCALTPARSPKRCLRRHGGVIPGAGRAEVDGVLQDAGRRVGVEAAARKEACKSRSRNHDPPRNHRSSPELGCVPAAPAPSTSITPTPSRSESPITWNMLPENCRAHSKAGRFRLKLVDLSATLVSVVQNSCALPMWTKCLTGAPRAQPTSHRRCGPRQEHCPTSCRQCF